MSRAREVDVVIVGAGPAGLAAAAELAAAGHQVAVVDEAPVPGGRLRAQWYRWDGRVFDGAREVQQLLDEIAAGAGTVTFWLAAAVVSVQSAADRYQVEVLDAVPPEVTLVSARAVLVATGATEVPIPLPGWTLPGVLAVGAAQTLWKGWHVPPGRRGVIVGTSPLAFAIAQELTETGIGRLPVVMPPAGPGTHHLGTVSYQWRQLLDLAAAAPAWARPLARWLRHRPDVLAWAVGHLPDRGVPVAGVRLRLAHQAVALTGEDRVQGVRLQRLTGEGRPVGASWVEPVDFVLLAGGLRPLADLLVLAGAKTAVFGGLGGEVPLVTEEGHTSVPGLFAAGNALGVESAPVAMAQGRVAALGIRTYLGEVVAAAGRERAHERLREARRHAPFEFQPGLREARAAHQQRSREELGS